MERVVEQMKVMKKAFIMTAALAVLGTGLGIGNQQVDAATRPTDVGKIDEGSRQALYSLYDRNLMGGYADGTFRPHNEVTRVEFAAMLIRALGLKSNGDNFNFSDSTYGKWFHPVLNVAYQYNLLGGNGVDKYNRPIMSPNKPITRMEMMLILVRANNMFDSTPALTTAEVDNVLKSFSDANTIPNWARADVAKAIKNRITAGVSTTKIGHSDKGQRLQSAVFSYRLLNKIEASGKIIELPAHKGGILTRQVEVDFGHGYLYVGEVDAEGNAAGKGILYYPDAKVFYDGQFLNDRPHGEGVEYNSLGQRQYVGSYQNGEAEGYGVYTGDDNEFEYQGYFHQGLYEGQGKYFEGGELVYEGSFVADYFTGQGKYYEDGKLIYEGGFLNDEFHGYGKLYDAKGKLIASGNFLHGYPPVGINKEITLSEEPLKITR